jgi:hypothetical protein
MLLLRFQHDPSPLLISHDIVDEPLVEVPEDVVVEEALPHQSADCTTEACGKS